MSSAEVDPPGRTTAPSPRVPSSSGGGGDGFRAAPGPRVPPTPAPPSSPAVRARPAAAAPPATATTTRMQT